MIVIYLLGGFSFKGATGSDACEGGDRCALLSSGAAVAGVYRVAGKDMAPLEAVVLGVGQTSLSVIISFSRVLATL